MDTSNIDNVSKFSYLKELLVPEARVNTESFPFTTEDYERAKQILKSTYGKTTEVINSYVQNIISLPIIKGLIQEKFTSSI